MNKLDQARKYAAKINHKLADGAFDDDAGFASHVTYQDKVEYARYQRQLAEEIEDGHHDNNFTIRQRMEYFLTGKCTPLLPF